MWVYHGIPSHNETAPIVSSYFAKMNLAKMGYMQNINDINDFEYQAYMVISNKYAEIENEKYRSK
jgi:hypothetical protein